jgi:hypothetical protein
VQTGGKKERGLFLPWTKGLIAIKPEIDSHQTVMGLPPVCTNSILSLFASKLFFYFVPDTTREIKYFIISYYNYFVFRLKDVQLNE